MELEETKRAQIVALFQSGMTEIDVGRQLGVSKQCVNFTIKRYRETGNFVSRTRSGRPRVTSPATDRKIRRACVINPTTSAANIRAELPPTISAPSTRTIQRRLSSEFKLKAFRPARKPALSSKNIRDRIAFCKKVKHWTAETWSNVLFSDETIVQQFSNRGSNKVRRPPNSRYNERYIIPTVKHSPQVMIWGSFSSTGRGNLYFLPPGTTMRSQNYLEMLKDRLPTMMQVRQTSIFMHDGAPCHKAKSVTEWLSHEDIEVLGPWPGNSPDLNPIENLWNIMKNKVSGQKPTNLDDLKECIKRVWCTEITPSMCKNLVESMPRRIAAVLQNGGKHSKY